MRTVSPICGNLRITNASGPYDALQTSYGAAAWRAAYLSTNQTAELRYAATVAGQYGFTVTHTQPGATPSSVTTNLAFEAIRIQSEPVTSDLATGDFVYNPSGMPVGGTDRFKISVAEGTVPADEITWTVKEGAANVSFANGDTGPEVVIHADALGAFKLEADVKGLVITPPNVRPFFTGQVLPAATVPVSVFIVRRNNGSDPARQDGDIPGLLTDANKILRQRGITLVQNGQTRHLDNDAYRSHTDLFNPANTNLYSMLNSTNSMGNALELYFVDTLEGGDAAGVRLYEGIVIATRGNDATIAHEVLHDCGTADIYTVEGQNAGDPIPGPVSQDRIPSDWGGGYYPPNLTQRELVARLIMRSGGIREIDTAFPRDLPTGAVFGWRHSNPADPSSTITLGPAGVGQSAVQGNPGSY